MGTKFFKLRRSKIEELEKELEEERKRAEILEQVIENPKEFARYLIKKLGIRGSIAYAHDLFYEIKRIKDQYVRNRIKEVGEENYIREVLRYKFGKFEIRFITSTEELGLTSNEINKYVKVEKEDEKIKITIYWLSGYREESTGLYVHYFYLPKFSNPLLSKKIEDALKKAFNSEGFYVKDPDRHLKVFSPQEIDEEYLKIIVEKAVKNLILPNF